MTLFTPRARYTILGYLPQVSPAYRQKLMSLGMLPGVIFEVIRLAPLADPIEIRIHRTHLMVRKKDLAFLNVQKIASLAG